MREQRQCSVPVVPLCASVNHWPPWKGRVQDPPLSRSLHRSMSGSRAGESDSGGQGCGSRRDATAGDGRAGHRVAECGRAASVESRPDPRRLTMEGRPPSEGGCSADCRNADGSSAALTCFLRPFLYAPRQRAYHMESLRQAPLTAGSGADGKGPRTGDLPWLNVGGWVLERTCRLHTRCAHSHRMGQEKEKLCDRCPAATDDLPVAANAIQRGTRLSGRNSIKSHQRPWRSAMLGA